MVLSDDVDRSHRPSHHKYLNAPLLSWQSAPFPLPSNTALTVDSNSPDRSMSAFVRRQSSRCRSHRVDTVLRRGGHHPLSRPLRAPGVCRRTTLRSLLRLSATGTVHGPAHRQSQILVRRLKLLQVRVICTDKPTNSGWFGFGSPLVVTHIHLPSNAGGIARRCSARVRPSFP